MNASQKRSFLGDCVTIQMSFSKLNAIPMIDLGIEHFKNIFMKKIGVLFGQERSFPLAFIERVNSKNISNILLLNSCRVNRLAFEQEGLIQIDIEN